MKHARSRATGGEPGIVLAESGNAGAAGGKSAFTRQRRRHIFDCYRIPRHAVRGGDQWKLAVHRIAYGDAVRAVPEGKAIIKSLGIAVGELPLPYLAAVRGFINTRLITGADAEHEGRVLVKGLDIAKIERVCSGND